MHWNDTGMGWGGRWEGGSGWGTHVQPWLIHVNVWQKPLQYCKVIRLQLKYFLKNLPNEKGDFSQIVVYFNKNILPYNRPSC